MQIKRFKTLERTVSSFFFCLEHKRMIQFAVGNFIGLLKPASSVLWILFTSQSALTLQYQTRLLITFYCSSIAESWHQVLNGETNSCFNIFYFYFRYTNVGLQLHEPSLCAAPLKARRWSQSCGTEITDSCAPPSGSWDVHLHPLLKAVNTLDCQAISLALELSLFVNVFRMCGNGRSVVCYLVSGMI